MGKMDTLDFIKIKSQYMKTIWTKSKSKKFSSGKQFSLLYWYVHLLISKILAMEWNGDQKQIWPQTLWHYNLEESENDGWACTNMKQRELVVVWEQESDDPNAHWNARKNFLGDSAWVEIRKMSPSVGDAANKRNVPDRANSMSFWGR